MTRLRYVNSDDCWCALGRDNRTGRMQPSEQAFPGGDAAMRNLSNFIHAKGLKFGLCTPRPPARGTLRHLTLPAVPPCACFCQTAARCSPSFALASSLGCAIDQTGPLRS